MPWKKRAPKEKPVTTWDTRLLPIGEVSAFLTTRAAEGWFIFSVVPADLTTICVTSCRKVYPPKSEATA